MKPLRVFLIDDHAIFRSALRTLLSRIHDVEVVGEDGDARSALEPLGQLRPDVLFLDVMMPGLSGIDAIRKVRAVTPSTRIVMLTHHEASGFVQQALEAGADGYLSKNSNEGEIELALDSVRRGDTYVSSKVTGALMTRLRHRSGEAVEFVSPLQSLTPREREVFQLLALGHCNKEVARDLGMSLGTAKKHRENLQRKLDCHSSAELARLAIREGLLTA
jgi:DNA-binding NarL/FixJ family response regulator